MAEHVVRFGSIPAPPSALHSGKPRVYQCPGCWSVGTYPQPCDDGWLECECGERMTLIDLRARTLEGPHEKYWHEDER